MVLLSKGDNSNTQKADKHDIMSLLPEFYRHLYLYMLNNVVTRTEADPGFPVGGGNPVGGSNVRHRHFSGKISAKMKELGLMREGGKVVCANGCPLNPPMQKRTPA